MNEQRSAMASALACIAGSVLLGLSCGALVLAIVVGWVR